MHERLAVIGDPIGHSLSPVMQGAALRASRLPWTYEARHVRPDELGTWVHSVRDTPYRGFNVTIPHKLAIRQYLDDVHADAKAIGAVNTVVNASGRLIGYNTDPDGFLAALAAMRFDPTGSSVVVFGAGGAAQAVVFALSSRAAQIVVVNRDHQRALQLANNCWGGAGIRAVVSASDSMLSAIREADLLVNATSLGMGALSQHSPLPSGAIPKSETVVLDLVYGNETPFVRTAALAGCRVSDGLEMLVQQGAAAFRLWTGVTPDTDDMRDACREAMEQRAC